MKPATTRIANCYRLESPVKRFVEIRRDNTTHRDNRIGRFVVATVCDRVAEDSWRCPTEESALAYAADRGYTDVVRADEVQS